MELDYYRMDLVRVGLAKLLDVEILLTDPYEHCRRIGVKWRDMVRLACTTTTNNEPNGHRVVSYDPVIVEPPPSVKDIPRFPDLEHDK